MSDIELDVGAATDALQAALAETQTQHRTHDAAVPAFKTAAVGRVNAARGVALAEVLSNLHRETKRRFTGLEQHTQLAQRHVAEFSQGDEYFARGVDKVGRA